MTTYGVFALEWKDARKLDLSDVSKELSFLLDLLRDDTPDEKCIEQHTSRVDWDQFMKLVTHHRISPLIYLKLKDVRASWIPEDVLDSLQLQYRRNRLKMLHLSREMNQICEGFTADGVRTLLLKGPVLAAELYGDLAHRTSKDLDLLVAEEDVERAELILVQLGYELEEEHILDNWKRKSHHMSLKHREHGVQVEVHWRLNPHNSSSYSFDQLWQRRNEIRFSHQAYPCLGHEDLLCYLTDHGARHGWFRLRWLLDIERLLPKIDVNQMLAHLERHGGQPFIGQAFILLANLLSTPIPHDLAEATVNQKAHQLAADALYYIKRIVRLNPVPEKSVAWHYHRYLASLMTTKQKIAYVLNKLLPSSLDASMLPLPRSLHFLYVPLRPFLWFWRRLKQPSM